VASEIAQFFLKFKRIALPFMDLEKLPKVEAEVERREKLSLQLQ